MSSRRKICITGGAGFIGTHVVRYFVKNYPNYDILVIDSLTYAGNYENISDLSSYPNFHFEKIDITDAKAVRYFFETFSPHDIIHLAAESHVDRSIADPLQFVKTNVLGTLYLLEAAKTYWHNNLSDHIFYHISTDEVYGSLGSGGFFTEETSYDPRSPYSASKASSDHFVRAYYHTYHLPILLSNCSNNYGAYQFPEKLIPLCIINILNKKPLPIYGNGDYTRDWLWVEDHVRAIDTIFHKGKIGSTYNIGGFNEWQNIDLVRLLCNKLDEKLGRKIGESEQLITFVKDRPGHDKRYAIDATKIQNELGWTPSLTFEEGLNITVDWYLGNLSWIKNVTSGEYQKYYKEHYA